MWVQMDTNQGKILVCCCYRHDKNEFQKDFHNCIDDIKSDKINNIFISGDPNADVSIPNGRKFNQLCQTKNLECLVHEATRITNPTATVLD